MSIEDRIATIADEAFGPFQMQSVDQNLDAIERGIASDKMERERLRAALEVARDLIIKHHNCSKPVQLGCLCPHCAREDGSSPELDQIWDALRTSNPESTGQEPHNAH